VFEDERETALYGLVDGQAADLDLPTWKTPSAV
jgi:hypothetical protein